MENIIETMINQHRILQKDLGLAFELSNNENSNYLEINNYLNKFKIDLSEHLNIENGIFYPELIIRMKNNKIDTVKTEEFISEMKKIGGSISNFLEKYNNACKIEEEFENFKIELKDIIFILNMRIESEESGVYFYWDLYK
jgi:iron-sulfur cluster repair protein YtfE (RIC family)